MHKEIIIKENENKLIPVIWTGEETQINYSITLNGKGAGVIFLALMLGKESQKIDIRTTVYHQHPETTSEVIIRGALTDNASINYEGLVKIEHGAKGTKAWLAAHLLLLSERSRGRAIPSLEILENDIKAGHATTVGRVNDLELFYLMSRGLSKEVAKGLIVEGFLQSLLDRFPREEKEKAKNEIKFLIPND